MAAPAHLARLSEVRDRTGVSVDDLKTLIMCDVIAGEQHRNSLYLQRDGIPTRSDIIAATRQSLAEQLQRVTVAAGRLRAEYEAIGHDARDVLEQLVRDETPLSLGDDIAAAIGRRPPGSPFEQARQALTLATVTAQLIHRVLVNMDQDVHPWLARQAAV